MHLEIGQTETFKISSEIKWNSTGLEIFEGEEYAFEATGKWKDATIECDADGFDKWFLAYAKIFRRAPKEKWFALIGMIDRSGTKYLIGLKNEIKFSNTGILYCFANDWILFYWNNHGSVDLTVKRLR